MSSLMKCPCLGNGLWNAWVDRRLKSTSGQHQIPFGGFSVILIGDFAQLPPVGDRALYTPPRDGSDSHGYTMYRLFTTVVILNEMVRQQGSTAANVQFRELLMRLRDGKSTVQDWQAILARTPQQATNVAEFNDAIQLYYTKEEVNRVNISKVNELSSPLALIKAEHSCSQAATAKSDEAGGLEAAVLLAEGAKVMLTSNLWQQTGLCNGAMGTVEAILYAEGHKPPNLPIAVLVKFPNYSGPPFITDNPTTIPISARTFEWHSGSSRMSRQQIPLRLSYAITIHKSQGQTLHKAVIIGEKERAAGSTFVAISRLRCLSDGLFHPMPFKRLESIGKLKGLQLRIEEEARLNAMAI